MRAGQVPRKDSPLPSSSCHGYLLHPFTGPCPAGTCSWHTCQQQVPSVTVPAPPAQSQSSSVTMANPSTKRQLCDSALLCTTRNHTYLFGCKLLTRLIVIILLFCFPFPFLLCVACKQQRSHSQASSKAPNWGHHPSYSSRALLWSYFNSTYSLPETLSLQTLLLSSRLLKAPPEPRRIPSPARRWLFHVTLTLTKLTRKAEARDSGSHQSKTYSLK